MDDIRRHFNELSEESLVLFDELAKFIIDVLGENLRNFLPNKSKLDVDNFKTAVLLSFPHEIAENALNYKSKNSNSLSKDIVKAFSSYEITPSIAKKFASVILYILEELHYSSEVMAQNSGNYPRIEIGDIIEGIHNEDNLEVLFENVVFC